MKRKLYNLSALLVMAFAFSGALLLTSNQVATAHGDEDHQHHTVAQAPTNTNNQRSTAAPKPVTYTYTAQPGDSYTLMARKAVQTYGKKANVKLSQAKIIYAETHLTQQAQSPYLAVSQKVEVTEATVKQWVEKAQTLTAAQETAWNYYVQFADFNTDKVGVAR